MQRIYHNLYIQRHIHKLKLLTKLTSKFDDDARPPVVSVPYIIMLFSTLLTCCKLLAVFNPSPGVCVDGDEVGEGAAVLPVPVLLAAPDFLFLLL